MKEFPHQPFTGFVYWGTQCFYERPDLFLNGYLYNILFLIEKSIDIRIIIQALRCCDHNFDDKNYMNECVMQRIIELAPYAIVCIKKIFIPFDILLMISNYLSLDSAFNIMFNPI